MSSPFKIIYPLLYLTLHWHVNQVQGGWPKLDCIKDLDDLNFHGWTTRPHDCATYASTPKELPEPLQSFGRSAMYIAPSDANKNQVFLIDGQKLAEKSSNMKVYLEYCCYTEPGSSGMAYMLYEAHQQFLQLNCSSDLTSHKIVIEVDYKVVCSDYLEFGMGESGPNDYFALFHLALIEDGCDLTQDEMDEYCYWGDYATPPPTTTTPTTTTPTTTTPTTTTPTTTTPTTTTTAAYTSWDHIYGVQFNDLPPSPWVLGPQKTDAFYCLYYSPTPFDDYSLIYVSSDSYSNHNPFWNDWFEIFSWIFIDDPEYVFLVYVFDWTFYSWFECAYGEVTLWDLSLDKGVMTKRLECYYDDPCGTITLYNG